jgi:hypothetical protein
MIKKQWMIGDFKIKRADLIILALLVVLSILPLFLSVNETLANSDIYAVIYVDAQKFKEIKLGDDVSLEFVIEDEDAKNVIIAKGDEIYMFSSSCHDQICVKQGKISKPGQSIVCLPNRIYIEIIGKEVQPVDDISR